MTLARVGLCVAACSLAACLGGTNSADPADGPRRRSAVSHVTIQVSDIESPPNLISLIQARVTNLDVRRNGACPDLEFRGRNSMMAPSPAGVYVNGQHALNTCILDMLNPKDVDLVEVYPMGVSNRPGYFATSGGLILVFLKDGGQLTEGGSR